jgi:hypothetical protein
MGWVQGAFFEYRNFKSLNTVTTIQSYMIPLKQTEMNVTCFKSRLAIFAPHIRVKYRHVNDLKDSIPRSVCIVGNYIFWAVEFPAGVKIYLLYSVHTGCGINLSRIQWITDDTLPGVKQAGLKADNLFTSSAKGKNCWSYRPTFALRITYFELPT